MARRISIVVVAAFAVVTVIVPTALASYRPGDFGPNPVDGADGSVATSSQGIEWLQVGIGLGAGIALVLGLGLAIRLMSIRTATHG